jgi:hypothetical protein
MWYSTWSLLHLHHHWRLELLVVVVVGKHGRMSRLWYMLHW